MAHTSGALRLGGFAGSTSVTIRLSMVLLMSANSKWTAGRVRSVHAELNVPVWDRVSVVPLGSDPAVFRPDSGLEGVFAARYRLPTARWLLTVARLVPHTVRALAEVTGTDVTELCTRLTATAERVFGSWEEGRTDAP